MECYECGLDADVRCANCDQPICTYCGTTRWDALYCHDCYDSILNDEALDIEDDEDDDPDWTIDTYYNDVQCETVTDD